MIIYELQRKLVAAVAIILIVLACFDVLPLVVQAEEQEEVEVDFPPLLDSDDIAYFFSNRDLDGLHWALSNVFRRSQRNTAPDEIKFQTLPETLISRGGGSTYTTAYKLKQDMEQIQYLLKEKSSMNESTKSSSLSSSSPLSDVQLKYLEDVVLPTLQRVHDRIPPLEELERTKGLYAFTKQDYEDGIAKVYNKAHYVTDFDVMRRHDDDDKHSRDLLPLLNDQLDVEGIYRQWNGNADVDGDRNGDSSIHNQPHTGIAVIDNLLSPEALDKIRTLLLSSTVFYQTKMPLTFGGYVGAYIDDGLYDKLLLQLAFELHDTLPHIMKDHPLKYLWAYRYDSNYGGIHTHADQAAVNVNIWLTPDEANLNKDMTNGGLVIYTAKPPPHWDFQQYNTNAEFVAKHILEPTNYANVTVPHRANRAVVFDSALFHHTDTFEFKEGYENRRINLTILYGDMQLQTTSSSTSSGSGSDSDGSEEL